MSSPVDPRKRVFSGGVRNEHPVDTSLIADHVKFIQTNGTTAVNVFGAKGAPVDITITGFIIGSDDTTGGNIALKQGSTTIASVAKGTSLGVMSFEEAALSSASITAGTAVTVVSSSAGNAHCWITYTVN